jgi:hypothetical protein
MVQRNIKYCLQSLLPQAARVNFANSVSRFSHVHTSKLIKKYSLYCMHIQTCIWSPLHPHTGRSLIADSSVTKHLISDLLTHSTQGVDYLRMQGAQRPSLAH